MSFFKKFNLNDQKEMNIFSFQNIRPEWTSCKYETLSKEGFCKNVIAYRSIMMICKAISSIPIFVKSENFIDKQTDLDNLLKHPNNECSKSAFIEHLVGCLLISGNAYVVISNDLKSLQILRPDRIKVITDNSNSYVINYSYTVDCTNSIKLPKKNVLHIKFFNPIDDWYGFSPLQAAFKAIDQHNAVSAHNLALLQNGGRPSGCLMVKNKIDGLSQQQRQEIRDELKLSYEGALNAGKIMVLEGDFEWKDLGFSPKDLDFTGGKNITAKEIALIYGIPPILLGLESESSFSNYKEARYHFWEDTILPMAQYIFNEIQYWLCPKFDENLSIEYNLDDIPALYIKREMVWNRISQSNFLTINEKRQALGYEPLTLDELTELKTKI